MTTDAIARANRLRELHVPGSPVVLVNVWDVASARVVAAHPGTRALATASWSVSAAAGYPDGGRLPLEVALLAARRVVTCTDLPVTVDFEKGYAATPPELEANVHRLIETGAAGLNLEDSTGDEEQRIWSITEASDRVASARTAAARAGIPIVINARTDILIAGGSIDDAVARGRAYLEAGADCVFVLGAIGPHLAEIVERIPGPVSVLAGAGAPAIPELARLGVARVSFGPGPMGVVNAALARLVEAIAAGEPPPADLANRAGATFGP